MLIWRQSKMSDNFARTEKKNLYSSTDAIGERARVSSIIKEGRESGMARGGESGGGGATGSWDTHVKGRDSSKNQNDRNLQAFKQYEGDIFLKHDDTPGSTSVSVREDSVGLQTMDGKVGLLVKTDGNILVQGKPVFKASGSNIIKGDYTENPDSTKLFTYTETIEFAGAIKEKIYEAAGQAGVDASEQLSSGGGQLMTDFAGYPPHNHNMLFKHVHAVEPTYLFRMPKIGLLDGIKGKLSEILKLLQ